VKNSSILEIKDLSVQYRLNRAVQGISFSIEKGESVGLLGMNGAGKTSTIRAILGMIRFKGEVGLFGKRDRGWKPMKRIGYAPEDSVPPEFLSGKEYLEFIAALRMKNKAKRAAEVNRWLELFELSPDKKIRDYSKGMKRKIVLAQAFVGSPDLLILDEPLNGLDPLVIMKLREVILNYRDKGTLLYSSHILSEVEKCCSRVIILAQGVTVLDESISKVTNTHGSVEKAFSKFAQGKGDAE
jgi:ABC-2 type transport system ATP-binding protein